MQFQRLRKRSDLVGIGMSGVCAARVPFFENVTSQYDPCGQSCEMSFSQLVNSDLTTATIGSRAQIT